MHSIFLQRGVDFGEYTCVPDTSSAILSLFTLEIAGHVLYCMDAISAT